MSDDEKLSYPADAYHNEEGMYVSPEPIDSDAQFTEVKIGETKFWLPKPSHKPCTRIAFEHATLFVEESIDTVQNAINNKRVKLHDGEWLEFTDPTFGAPIRIDPMALTSLIALIADWWDMENEKLKIRNSEYQKKLATTQLDRAGFELAVHEGQQKKVGRRGMN